MLDTTKEMSLPATFNMNINGKSLIGKGEVKGIPGSGFCSAQVITNDNIPDGFQLMSLTPTGHTRAS